MEKNVGGGVGCVSFGIGFEEFANGFFEARFDVIPFEKRLEKLRRRKLLN